LAEVTRWTSSSGCIIIAEKRGRVVKINGADLTNPSWRPSHLSVLILIAAAILIYCTYLHYAPIYLAHDEGPGALPHHERYGSYYVTPMVIYVTAVFLKFLPFTESVCYAW
jgi:hypothetical protein